MSDIASTHLAGLTSWRDERSYARQEVDELTLWAGYLVVWSVWYCKHLWSWVKVRHRANLANFGLWL